MPSLHGSHEEHTPISPSEDAVGAWDAASARDYLEYSLSQELETFAQLYGADALVQQLANEGQRLGFQVWPEGV